MEETLAMLADDTTTGADEALETAELDGCDDTLDAVEETAEGTLDTLLDGSTGALLEAGTTGVCCCEEGEDEEEEAMVGRKLDGTDTDETDTEIGVLDAEMADTEALETAESALDAEDEDGP